MSIQIITGDCIERLREMPADSVHCVVTSPPYYGLRDYGTATWEGGDPGCDHIAPTWQGQTGQRADRTFTANRAFKQACGKCGATRKDDGIGLEATPEAHIAKLVEVFREVRRVLRKDGTLWLNYGDAYANDGKWGGSTGGKHAKGLHGKGSIGRERTNTGLKPKDLMMMPARVALALQADGWWLRSEIIWAKPNPMPESVTDRPTSAHEKIYLLAKSARYFYDAEAVREDGNPKSAERYRYGFSGTKGADAVNDRRTVPEGMREFNAGRNLRNVWNIATAPFPGAHFSTFPPALVEPCIKAGCPDSGTVLDPFCGSGTTGLVADRLGRDAVLIELNPEYAAMAKRRVQQDAAMFAEVS